MKKFPLLFVLLVVLTCCDKKDGHVKIITQDALSGERFPDQNYTITSIRTKDNLGYRIEKEGKTDSNGEDKFSMNLKSGRTYSVKIANSGSLVFCRKEIQQIGSSDQVNGTITFQMVHGANFRYGSYNVNCSPAGNDLFKLYYGGSDFEPLTTEQLIRTEYGCGCHPATFFEEIPMGRRFYKWEVTRNGNTNTYYDTISVQAADNKTHDFLY